VQRTAIALGALPLGSRKQLIAERVIHHTDDDFPLPLDSNGDAEKRIPVGIVGRAVQGIL
jgi:hypothetical protein